MNEADGRTRAALARLLEIMRRLRDPGGGCPWDREQTFSSIAPYTIEEAYEVADAIGRGEAGEIESRARRPAVPGGVSRADGQRARLVRFRQRGQAISDKLTGGIPMCLATRKSAR